VYPERFLTLTVVDVSDCVLSLLARTGDAAAFGCSANGHLLCARARRFVRLCSYQRCDEIRVRYRSCIALWRLDRLRNPDRLAGWRVRIVLTFRHPLYAAPDPPERCWRNGPPGEFHPFAGLLPLAR